VPDEDRIEADVTPEFASREVSFHRREPLEDGVYEAGEGGMDRPRFVDAA
jgi:hypothetical protein